MSASAGPAPTAPSAIQALAHARAADPTDATRQVGVVDAHGSAVSFTGTLCVGHAGEQLGPGYAVQANMMATPQVSPAMAAAYEAAPGPFPQRLLEALRAGEDAGGDARGRMAAALLAVSDAFACCFRAIDAMGAGNAPVALAEIDAAAAALPDDENIRFARAGALMLAGRVDEGRVVMRDLMAGRASWTTIARSLADKGIFPTPPEVDLDELLRP